MTATRGRPRVTLDQLHTFLAVADHEHVTRAAALLGHSQGSVSGQVHRLERLLGVPLLHRVGRNVRLTDVGRALRQLSIQALDVADEIEQLASGYLAFEAGHVSIGAGRAVGAHRLSGWLAPFVAAHPEIDVSIRLAPINELASMLSTGSADIIFAGAAINAPGVENLVVERTELVVLAATQHPLAAMRSPGRALASHRYLAHQRGTATRTRADQVLGELRDTVRTVELEEAALGAALLAGLGFSVMPQSVVQHDIDAHRLVVLPFSRRPVFQDFVAASRSGLRPPAARACWSHLERLASQHQVSNQ